MPRYLDVTTPVDVNVNLVECETCLALVVLDAAEAHQHWHRTGLADELRRAVRTGGDVQTALGKAAS